jgi:hypothetical protein
MNSKMSNNKLSESDKQEICATLAGLKGAKAKSEAQSLADFYQVSYSQICAISKDVRPLRKKRSDAGKRQHQLLENEALKFAAELVVNQQLNPELALETMHENSELFGTVDIKLGTFRRYLREHGISRTQMKKKVITHRPFRAEFPGQIFQVDISGVKERWVNLKTRAIHKVSILEVSKNHPQRRNDLVPLWKFVLKDDYSRFKFLMFIACNKPNTIHFAEFLKLGFQKMGTPFKLYSDNDAIIVNKRMQRGAKFINELFESSGGFVMEQHMPGKPNATGKVERSHQIVEEFEKLIGVSHAFGNKPNIAALNRFATYICDKYNKRVHSTIKVAPVLAFRETTNPKRMINPKQFDAAFKARDLELKVHSDVTISVDSIKYQLSRKDSEPFLLLAETGQKLKVYWLDDEDYFACVTPAGEEYIVDKVIAKADVAGEYKALPETKSQKNQKILKASQKERRKEIKEIQKTQDTPVIIVPGIDTEIEAKSKTNMVEFPVKIETGNIERLNELTHQVANPEIIYARPIDFIDALEYLQENDFAPDYPCDELNQAKNWLVVIFNGRETITEEELKDCLIDFNRMQSKTKLRLA